MVQVIGVDHISVHVGDFEKSKRFYSDLFQFLGFEVLGDLGDAIGWTNGKTRYWISKTDAEGKKHPFRIGNLGLHHFAFELSSRKDVDELQAFLDEKQFEIADRAGEYYDDYYAVYFLDPDGMKIEGMKYGELNAARQKDKD